MRRLRHIILVGVGLAAFVAAPPAVAAVWQVDTTSDAPDDTPGDGICSSLVVVGPPVGIPPLPQLGFRCTLRGAIQEANLLPGKDDVVLSAGVYVVQSVQFSYEDDDTAEVGDLDLLEDIEIVGAGIDATTIDVSGGWGVDIHGGTIGFDSLTLAGDPALPLGVDGIRLRAGDLELFDFRSRDWFSAVEGRVTVAPTSITAQNSEFLAPLRGKSVDLEGVRIQYTSVTADQATIRNSTFQGDGTTAVIGLLLLGDATIEGSTFVDHGVFGIAAQHVPAAGGGSLRVTNSTFSGIGSGTGAAILLASDLTTLEYVTIHDSPNNGLLALAGSVVDLDHTIIAGSGAADCSLAIAANSQFSLDSDGSCGLTHPTDIPGADPQLLPLADNGGPTSTHALASSSPARDGGGTPCGSTVDQRGQPRPRGAACDIGAYEAAVIGGTSCGLGFELAVLLPILWTFRKRQRSSGLRRCSAARALCVDIHGVAAVDG